MARTSPEIAGSQEGNTTRNRDSFEQTYRCYPLSHTEKSYMETGDKIIMPVSALERLISINIDYPMLFEIQNLSAGRVSHCGVLEFSGTEGLVFIPEWMMKNMRLGEGDDVKIKNVSLPKGTYLKLQPHTMEFTRIRYPKEVLEGTLRSFSCLSVGDTIMISHENKKFFIDIVETKPNSAVSVIETDCEVDFAPPLDYKEPEKPKPKSGFTLKKSPAKVEEESEKEEPKFKPFIGKARRLDGKPVTESMEDQLIAANGKSSTDESNFGSRKRRGKLVGGSDENGTQPPMRPVKLLKEDVKGEILKKEEEKFKPFTGKKYTLTE